MKMKNILIISATMKTNYKLSKDIQIILKEYNVNTTLISLENYDLPLYTDKAFKDGKNDYETEINELTDCLVTNEGIIICGPEYNGSISPIITNAIAWISTCSNYWKDSFENKNFLIATSSGGLGNKFIMAMKIQLEHLGAIVMPKSINVNENTPLKIESAKKILKQFITLI